MVFMCKRSLLTILSWAALTSTLCFAANTPPKLRLNEVQKIDPVSYRVDLTLDPEKDDFTGIVVIKLDIKESTDTLWLNQESITIQSAVLDGDGETNAAVIPGGDDFVGFKFPKPIAVGAAEITIHYKGTVFTKNSSGLFRQQDSNNWYLFSQFEPTDARAAFPCFDEPSYKTPWQLTLHVPSQDTAVSNTGILNDKVKGATRTVTFRETLPLPSYLVALGVGPFEYVDAGKAGRQKVPVRIVVPKGHAAEAKYAAEHTAEIITRHEEYFGMDYPYDKADQLAIPNTVGFGAMENPGLVTYEMSLLCVNPQRDTIGRQREFIITAAHELAHQWFGDIVTTAWWNDIWLNEAFATWMEQKYSAEYFPEWDTRVSDVDSKLYAESEDSLITSRKIRQPIEAKDDINSAFDAITYNKGAAVIGMFENWMGPKEFQQGVQAYLKQYKFKATTANDFLDSLSSASKRNVTQAFFTFLNQAGVPLVTVGLACSPGAPTLHVEQERYLPAGSKGSTDQTWQIPMCIRYGTGDKGESVCKVITDKSTDWQLEAKQCPAWVEANDKALGYYRTNYKGDLLSGLVKGDVTKRLSAAERADLIGNARSLTSGGQLRESQALELVEQFHADPARQVEESALSLASSLHTHLVAEKLIPNYQRFIQKNFDQQARELGWTPRPKESDDTRLIRPTLVETVATYGDDRQLAKEASTLTDQWLKDHNSVDANLVSSILSAAVYYGDKPLFDKFLAEFKETKDRQVRRELIGAMSGFRDREAIEAGMEAVLKGDIPFLEGAQALFSGQGEAATRKMAFDFLKAHYDEIVSKMPTGGGFDFGTVLPQVGATYCDAKSKAELQEFFAPRIGKFIGGQRALDQVLESIDLCASQVEAKRADVSAFLEKY